jgi:hypothetical protein
MRGIPVRQSCGEPRLVKSADVDVEFGRELGMGSPQGDRGIWKDDADVAETDDPVGYRAREGLELDTGAFDQRRESDEVDIGGGVAAFARDEDGELGQPSQEVLLDCRSARQLSRSEVGSALGGSHGRDGHRSGQRASRRTSGFTSWHEPAGLHVRRRPGSPRPLTQPLPGAAARTENAGPRGQRLTTEDERHRMVRRELSGSYRVRLSMPARAVPAVDRDPRLDRPLRQPPPG